VPLSHSESAKVQGDNASLFCCNSIVKNIKQNRAANIRRLLFLRGSSLIFLKMQFVMDFSAE